MKKIFRGELMKEIKDGIVAEVMEKKVKHWNPSFIIHKVGGKFRKILDCREVNKATMQLHYKIDGTKEVMVVIQQGDFATKLDLEGTCHHIKVEERLSKYFGFRFEGREYAFMGLPFGWVHSYAIFCKVLRIANNAIREQLGMRFVAYMDDLLLLGQDRRVLEGDTVQ
ncbi:MAG: hypothetical protein EZS28_027554, partial [Streblomastix strix]